jgi:antitoxin HicB
MGTAWVYPVTLEPDDNGTLLVTFPDIEEAHTFGDDTAEALRHAQDALVTVLEGYMGSRRPIPRPSDVDDESLSVVLPMIAAAKVELYEAMREQGLRKADLARRLGWHAPQVDRLLDLRHASRVDHLQEALGALNRTLIVRGAGLRPGVPVPRRVMPGQRYKLARRAMAKKPSPARATVAKRAVRKVAKSGR